MCAKPFLSARLLAYINTQRLGLEACVIKLQGKHLNAKERKKLKSRIRGYRWRLDCILDAIDKAKAKAESVRLGIPDAYEESLDPNRKSKARAPNRGFKRTKPPSPNGKNRGAFIVVRPKPRG